MSSLNATTLLPPPPPPPLQNSTLLHLESATDASTIIPLTTFVLGFAVENSISGIISNMVRISVEPDRTKKYPLIFNIITLFNFIAVVYNVLFLCHYFLKESNCVWVDFMTNIFSHSYYLVFDSFILYKTWTITQYRPIYIPIFTLALLHRFTWALYDLSTSTALWTPQSHCEFIQNPISGTGASAADILCDTLATLTCLYTCRTALKDCFSLGPNMDAFRRLLHVLVNENVVRSAVVLVAHCLIVWCTNTGVGDGSFVLLFYAVLSLVYVWVINLEFLWVEARQRALSKRSGTRSAKSAKSAKSGGGGAVVGGGLANVGPGMMVAVDMVSSGVKGIGGGGTVEGTLSSVYPGSSIQSRSFTQNG
ncbi:hypothetical protein BCR33DRAFT_767924, partial [Rhizoclosmatium globosum]